MGTADIPRLHARQLPRKRWLAWLALSLPALCACSSSPTLVIRAPLKARASVSIAAEPELDAVVPDCTRQEASYFQCMLRGDAWGAVAICGQAGPDGVPVGLQVRLLTPDGTAVTVPAVMAQARDVLSMHVITQPQLSYQAISFEHDGRTWTVFSEYNAEVNSGVPMRGVRVVGAETRAWYCSAEPIDRLGELEPYLTPDVVATPMTPVALRAHKH